MVDEGVGPVEIRILGPLEVLCDNRPVALPQGRCRVLLALLALHPGQVISADRLIHELWGETPPRTARKSLQNLVVQLRKQLCPGEKTSMLQTRIPGYVLTISHDQVDVGRFRRLVEQAASAATADRAAWLRQALALWRGPALADFAYEPFTQPEIAALEELRQTAVEERVDADLALGRHAELVAELESLVAEYPYRERLRAQLMLALYRGGRQVDALEAYQAGRRLLIEELGIEPGPVLVQLEQAILNQDPSLTGTAEPATVESSIEPAPWFASERKTVTVAYVELTESTPADPEVLRHVMARGMEVVSSVVGRHGGTVQGLIGDVVVAVFGVPAAREDDALRAVRAAVELREALPTTNRGTRLVARIGINSGEVVVGDPVAGPAAGSGDAVTLAAQLQQAAAEDEILIGEATRQLLGDAAWLESASTLVLDRHGRPAQAWRLARLMPDTAVRSLDRSQPLVGRTRELAVLHRGFQRAVRHRHASRFTVLGEPGVGKSRLALEFVEALGSTARVLSCRCPAYGEGITFWPLRELVVQAAGEQSRRGIAAVMAAEGDAEHVAREVAAAIGLSDEPGAGKELFGAVRRLMETLAAVQPVAVVVEDVQWAQPTFLDLVDYLAESVQAPLLLLCLARTEMVELRPGWAEQSGVCALDLEPLRPQDSERLVTDRLVGRLVPEGVVGQVVEMAQGNPLFLEQLLAALREGGKLRFPPSVHALLAARLDRLGPAERDLLRSAAVVGDEFSAEALTALIPDQARRFLDSHLDMLQRKELIQPARRSVLGGRTFAFRHILIQQAAYRSTTRQVRAELHQEFAEWLEQRATPALADVVAYHLEQASAQRHRLGLIDRKTHELTLRAGEALAQAGLRAYRRFDMTAAENLLSRARPLLPPDHPQRYEVLRRLSEAYPTLGRLTDAEAVLAEMLHDPRVKADPRLAQRLRFEQLKCRLIAGPDPVWQETIRAEVERALEILEPTGDHIAMSQACYLLATMHLRSGRIPELAEVGRRGLDHARRSGDLREHLGALWWPAWGLVAGPTPVPEAIRGCQELQRAGPGEHVGVLTDLARLRAMTGAFAEARELLGRARRQLLERIRVRRALTVLAHRTGEVEVLADNLPAAERTLREVIEVALDVGERDQTALIAADLSRVLSAQGNAEEADTFASLSQHEAPAESVIAQALWRAATARALALRETTTEAERLAKEAVNLVPVDMLNLRADLSVDLAEVLLANGQRDAARAALDEAVARYERKGNLVGARKARAALSRTRAEPSRVNTTPAGEY